MGRIFLSHSSADNAAAIALSRWLDDQGWNDHFLDLDPERGIAAGERWERALNEAALRCQAVVFLVSRAWLGSQWCHRELQLAHRLDKHIFGVLIDEEVVLADVPPKLKDHWQLVDLAGGRDHGAPVAVTLPDGSERHVTFSRAGLLRLKAGLEKAEIDARFFAWPPKDDPDRPPWRGMRPLEAEDAGIFHGREAPTVAVLDRLRGLREAAPPRFLAILGASGAGKSSFLRAGIMPRLARDTRNFLALPILRPERAALSGRSGLAAGLAAAAKAQGLRVTRAAVDAAIAGGAGPAGALLSELAAKARMPALGADDRPEPPTLVLAIDQAEELFQAEGRAEASALLVLLAGLLAREAPKLVALFTIRSDSYERLQVAPELEGVRQTAFSLPPLPRGAYQTVIEGPLARLAGTPRELKIEPALTARLLEEIEAGGGRDSLPLLAFALESLYDRHGADGDLTLAEFSEMGGIAGSIDAAVGRAFARADADPAVPRDREARLALMRRAMIPWLAGIDPETGSPRRHVARLSEIPEEARPLVAHMVAERLLATERAFSQAKGDALGLVGAGETTVEPAHEALLRQWGLLKGWLAEDAAQLSALEAVARATRDWEANGRDAAWLSHQAGRLEDAERLAGRPDLWAKLGGPERAYLAACRAQENFRRDRELEEARKLAEAQRLAAERQRQVAARTRVGAVAALVLAALAGLFGWYGLEQSREARRQAELATAGEAKAEAERAEAERQAAIAQAEKERADGLRKSALAAEADRYSSVAEGLLANGRPDLALSAALAVAPAGAGDDRPLTPELATVIQRSATSTPAHVVRRLTGNVRKLVTSRDGRLLASAGELDTAQGGSQAGMLHVFDTKTMEERFRIKAADDYVVGVDISADGSSIATAGSRNPGVFDAQTGVRKFDVVLPESTGRMPSKNIRYAPDGSYIVVSTLANQAMVYDAADGRLRHVLWAPEFADVLARVKIDQDPIVMAVAEATWKIFGGATEIAVSPDSSVIAVAGSGFDGGVQVFDARTGALRIQLSGGVADAGTNVPMFGVQLAFTPDGSAVVSALGSALKVWDLASGDLRVETAAFDLTTFTVMDDSRSLIFGRNTGELVSLCLASPFETTRLQAHSGPIDDILVDSQARRLLTTSRDGTAKIWTLPTGEAVCGTSFSRSQVSSDGVAGLQPLAVLPGHSGETRGALGAAGGAVSYTGDGAGALRAWFAAPPPRLEVDLKLLLPSSSSSQWSDSTTLLPARNGAQLFLHSDHIGEFFSALDLQTLHPIHMPTGIIDVATRPDEGPPVLFMDIDRYWRMGDFPRGQAPGTVYGVDVSPRGDRALVRSDSVWFSDYRVLVDIETGKRISDLRINGRVTKEASFSPDGSKIIGTLSTEPDSDADGSGLFEEQANPLAIWDARTGQLIGTSAEFTSYSHVADDGTRFVSELDAESNKRLAVYAVNRNALIGKPITLEDDHYTASAISPDGSIAAFAHGDGKVSVVDLATTLTTRTLDLGATSAASHLAISPDGSLLAAIHAYDQLVVVDMATGRQIDRATLHDSARHLLFAGNGQIVVLDNSGGLTVSAPSGRSRAADLNVLFPPASSSLTEGGTLPALIVSRDGELAFMRANSGSLLALDLATGAQVDLPADVVNVAARGDVERPLLLNSKGYSWQFGDAPPTAGPSDRVRFWTANASPTGHRQVWLPGQGDPTGTPPILRDADTGAEIGKLVVGQRIGSELRFSPDGSHIAGQLMPNGLGVWHSDDASPLAYLGDLPFAAEIRMSEDASRLLIFSRNTGEQPVLVDRVAGTLVDATPSLLREVVPYISDAAIAPDGGTLITGDTAGRISVRWLGQPKPGSDVAYFDEPVERILVSPGGSVFAASGEQGALAIGEMKSGARLMHVAVAREVAAMCFLGESRIAVADGEHMLRVFDVSSAQATVLAEITLLEAIGSGGIEYGVEDLTCSEDGRLVFIRDGFGSNWALDWNSATQFDLDATAEFVAARGRGARPRLFGEGRHWSLGDKLPPVVADPVAGASASLSSTGNRGLMRSLGNDATVLVDLRTWTTLRHFDDDTFLGSIEFSTDGTRVVYRGRGDAAVRLSVWESDDGTLVADLPFYLGQGFTQVAFDRRGNRFLLTGAEGKRPAVLAITDGRFEELPTPAFADFVAAERDAAEKTVVPSLLSPDGGLAILGGLDGSVSLVGVGNATPTLRLAIGSTAITRLEISDDGSLVAAADGAQNLVVADVHSASVRLRRRLDTASDQLRFVGTDGLLVSDVSGRLRIFQLWPDEASQIDWLRAALVPFASHSDRQRFGVPSRTRSDRPDLQGLATLPPPPGTGFDDAWISAALEEATEPDAPAGLARALSMLARAGLANPAEAAMRLGLRAAGVGGDPAATRRAFFLAAVGFELEATVDGLPDFTDSAIRTTAADLVRNSALAIGPVELVDAYRAARDWRAGPSPF